MDQARVPVLAALEEFRRRRDVLDGLDDRRESRTVLSEAQGLDG